MTEEEAIRKVRADFARSGGAARAKKLTPARRKEIARAAAGARWNKEAIVQNLDKPNLLN